MKKKRFHAEAQRRRGGGRARLPTPASRLFLPAAALRLCVMASTALAQEPPPDPVNPGNSTGVESYGSYAGLRENVKNRNLNVVIPLFTLAGRNGLDYSVAANYNAIQRQWVESEHVGEPDCDYLPIPNSGNTFPPLARIPLPVSPPCQKELTWVATLAESRLPAVLDGSSKVAASLPQSRAGLQAKSRVRSQN